MPKSTAAARGGYKVRPQNSLKAAVHDLLTAVTVERAMDLTGKGRSALYRYGDADEPEHHMPVHVAAQLTRDSGCDAVADYLAREAGCVLLPITPLGGPAEVAAAVGQLGASAGDVFKDYGAALADGRISEEERGQLIADLHAVSRAAISAVATLQDGAGDGAGDGGTSWTAGPSRPGFPRAVTRGPQP